MIATSVMRRLAAGLALAALLCVGVAGAAYLLRPPIFRSHSEAAAYLLERRGVAVSRIDASLPWPDAVNYYAYGPAVYPYNLDLTIDVADGRQLAGKVECRRDRFDCRLTVDALRVDRVVMPDVSDGAAWRLPGWLERVLAYFDITV